MGVWVKKRCEKLRIRSFGAGIFPFKCPCPETFRLLGNSGSTRSTGAPGAPGGAQSDGTPKIINQLITHNTTQFKKSKSTENIVAFSSTLSSTFYVS